jgi:manganese-dependent ADP-ribose/CDP-alcohol diphosphatase
MIIRRAMQAVSKKMIFRFGAIADVQYADIDDALSYSGDELRSYRRSLQGLEYAVEYWNTHTPDIAFIAQLGDLIDGQNAGTYGQGLTFSSTPKSEAAMDAVLSALDRCVCKNVVHATGNHELYNFNREQLDRKLNTVRDGHEFYSFSPISGWRVVMLDGYDVAMIGRDTGSPEYQSALQWLKRYNPNDVASPIGTVDWFRGLPAHHMHFVPYNGGLGEEQLEWLRSTLRASHQAGERVIVLSHIGLSTISCNRRTVLWNYEDVLSVLTEEGQGCVVAVFAGHSHKYGTHTDEHGIHHVTLDTPLSAANKGYSFAHVEIFEDHIEFIGQGSMPHQTFPLSPTT